MASSGDVILKIILGIHFVCINMVFMHDWLPLSYKMNQILILVLYIWAVLHKESQVTLLFIVQAMSITFDVIGIGMYFHIGKAHTPMSSYFVLSVTFAIILLIIKPLMLWAVYVVRKERVGEFGEPSAFGNWGQRREGYNEVQGA